MKPDPVKWKVTPMLFSGRQNPHWKLTTAQQKSWMVLWQHASLSDKAVETPSLLGYTGCRLQYNQHSHWQLYNGCVTFFDDGKLFSKNDEEKQMELFLLNTASEEVKEILKGMEII